MKEAAGEANLTVVAIILIAVIAAFVGPLISRLLNSTSEKTDCYEKGGVWTDTGCIVGESTTPK